MPRLFGTDGIRGVANVELRAPLAYALGRATAARLAAPGEQVLVGRDTRRSGPMLEAALAAGLMSMGVDVVRMGVVPTPALAWATAALGFRAGVMVSASHNPADDNGLKVLDADGRKLDEAREEEIEGLMEDEAGLGGPGNDGLGRPIDDAAPLAAWMADRMRIAGLFRSDLPVCLDAAHGSASAVAAPIVAATGARVDLRYADPDGRNINDGCGATHPEALAAIVAAQGAAAGFAFDGDADRCVAVDERGEVVDGDRLIGIIALDRLARGSLDAGSVVVSILSNAGLVDAIQAAGGRVERTPVGDRWILDAMLRTGAGVGGEKSGHVIVREHALCGDGIVTALEVLGILARTGRPLSELAARIPLYPQEQRAVRVARREAWAEDGPLVAAIREAEAELAGRGRIVVRPSGTEPSLRIMVEGPDAGLVRRIADELTALAGERLR